jgi:hypothetical protein
MIADLAHARESRRIATRLRALALTHDGTGSRLGELLRSIANDFEADAIQAERNAA